MTEEITTGAGIYRVSVIFEKIDPETREVLSMRKYRSEDIVDLKSGFEVTELAVRARDRAVDSRKRLTKPSGSSAATPPTSKSPTTT